MISLPAHVTYACLACDATVRALGWSVIDAVERPELVNYLGDDAWWVRTCVVCEEPAVRVTPLLVMRLDPVAPLVLGVPDDALHVDPGSMPATPLLERTHAEIEARGLDVPGPVLLTPFVVVARAAARDVSQDDRESGARCRSAVRPAFGCRRHVRGSSSKTSSARNGTGESLRA